jgi:branched-chain amino acid transport system substrate-binding protein
VTGLEIYPTGATDFSMGLLKAKKTNTEIINIWMDMPESAILLKQWYDMKIPALPFGSTLAAAEQPGFWEATDGKGEYTLCNVVNAGNAPSNATPWTMKFYTMPTPNAGMSSRKVWEHRAATWRLYLRDAIERAGSLDPTRWSPNWKRPTSWVFTAGCAFDPKSHQVIPSTDPKEGAVGSILQWQDGKRVVVYPKSIAMGEIQLPPWMGNLKPNT